MEENVTHRKPQKRTYSLNDLTSNNSSITEHTILSLQNTSIDDSYYTKELKEKIYLLHKELETAHLEIEILNTENTDLKRELEKKNNTLQLYKKIGFDDNKYTHYT
ncbi:hypothetical protein O3G_MSEX008793 [Manduca sexta]|uniref:Uncharacterized protein n=1 Tax=Manduca sexta TaxID=7130 RepID=A0A921ZCY9_MANSE|nr:hypothetical protein O3G_MSEX008793 [Manduca sexta]